VQDPQEYGAVKGLGGGEGTRRSPPLSPSGKGREFLPGEVKEIHARRRERPVKSRGAGHSQKAGVPYRHRGSRIFTTRNTAAGNSGLRNATGTGKKK